MRAVVSQSDARSRPDAVWNAFIELLVTVALEDLEDQQRGAYFAYWYDSEMQNGGHFQYFENRNIDEAAFTIDALKELGAVCQSNILRRAYAVVKKRSWGEITTTEEFVNRAIECDLNSFDTEYYSAEPKVCDLLEKHLNEQRDIYIQISAV